MTAQTEIAAVPPKETALQVFQAANGLDPYLKKIREEIDAFVPDVSSRKGRDAIASIAYKVARSKSALDNVGKELVAELKEIPKKIDAERKRMRDTLDAWQEEVRRPLNEWQTKEDARVDKHNDGITRLKVYAEELEGITAEDLADRIEKVDGVAIGEQWEEFEAEAARAKDRSLKTLRDALAKRQQYESEQAELVRLRAEAEAREQKDREERIAREAAEKASREAEEKSKAERDAAARREQALKDQAEQARLATERAEADRQAAEQRAEQEKQQAERRAEEAAEAARQDERRRADAAAAEILRQQEARERDKAHQAKINREALAAFVAGGMTEECARQAVTLIAKRQIPNVSISY